MTYRYHRIGKHLVCVDQSIPGVIGTMLLGYEKYRLQSIGLSRSAARKAVLIVARGKLGFLHSRQRVMLPVAGQVAMQVHRGFKIFDFKHSEVAKVFDVDASSDAARKEVAASRQASNVGAAPRFIAEDPGLAWYREEYVCGDHATDPGFRGGKQILDFYPDVEACLLDLVACQPLGKIDTSSHLDRHAEFSCRDRWLNAGHDRATVDEIAEYLGQLHNWLTDHASRPQLQLVLTHGDFSLVNAISTNAGLRFIDWEGIAPGGLYSDIFNFLFVERYYGRASAGFEQDLAAFVHRYREACRMRFPELREAADGDLTFARRQYYLERLSLLLDRAESDNLCKVVCKSIAMFRDFDREAGDVAVEG